MLLQDGIGIIRPLALTDRFKACRQVQPADAGKQADMGEFYINCIGDSFSVK